MTKQVMNVYASPCTFEFTRFPTKDKSETLSSKYVCLLPSLTKLENVFYIHGVLDFKFEPNIPKFQY